MVVWCGLLAVVAFPLSDDQLSAVGIGVENLRLQWRFRFSARSSSPNFDRSIPGQPGISARDPSGTLVIYPAASHVAWATADRARCGRCARIAQSSFGSVTPGIICASENVASVSIPGVIRNITTNRPIQKREKKVDKKALNWSELGFDYIETDVRFRAVWASGKWGEGELINSAEMLIHEGSPVLHYAQTCFEGLKAQTAPNGDILLFRPDLNCARMASTTARLLMPGVPESLFMQGVLETVRANAAWVPPYGSGASLYIRPFLVGVGKNLGLRPAPNYEFRVFVSPVGPYYKGGGLSLIDLAVIDLDRAAPKGTGAYKAGANYAGGLLATQMAKDLGAQEALYLDPAEHRYLEEAGSANIVLVMKDGSVVTPKSESILPSITRRSVMTLAAQTLGRTVEERPIDFFAEVDQIDEFAACGTAAVISPVSKIRVGDTWHKFYGDGKEIGPVTQALYDRLTAIQKGETEDTFGWTEVVPI